MQLSPPSKNHRSRTCVDMVIDHITKSAVTKRSLWMAVSGCATPLSASALSLVRSSRPPPTCLINVNTNTAGDSGPGCNKHRRHESPLCLSNQSPSEPQAACSHLTWKPASWHLVSLKMQRINPCGVVRNYFDLECRMEFVVYIAQTLTMFFFFFVNSFICM